MDTKEKERFSRSIAMSSGERKATRVPVYNILQLCIISNVFMRKGSAAN